MSVFYVVVAMPHNGGHGPWPAPILITGNPTLAIKTARDVERLGFEIDWSEDSVTVYRMMPNFVYSRAAFKAASTDFLVYTRSKDGLGKFDDYFWDKDLAKHFGMTVAEDLVPSERLNGARA